MNNSKLRIKLVAIARDEAAYLPEWIFHHLTFGFDEIEIYVNNTVDNTYQVIENIAKHHPVIVTDADPLFQTASRNFQLLAYENAVEKAKQTGFSHIMFLDIDEFWTPADFKTDIKSALKLYDYPQALCLNWFVHCDESEFSSCYKSRLKVIPNPHVKTIFELSGDWDKLEIHNIVGERIVHTRGDGSAYDFKSSAHCGLTDADCIEHDFFVVHRMYRSQMEYISLLGRGRANKLKLKDNRNGYYTVNAPFKSINIDEGLLSSYYQDCAAFIEQCELSHLMVESKQFIESRYQRVIVWANKANRKESEIFDKLLKNIKTPEVQSIKNSYERYKRIAASKNAISNLPSFSYLVLLVLSKLLFRFGLEKLSISTYLKASKLNKNIKANQLSEVIKRALENTNYPPNKYADIYREIAIQFYQEKDLQQALFFITKAKVLRPTGVKIIQLYEQYFEESELIHCKK